MSEKGLTEDKIFELDEIEKEEYLSKQLPCCAIRGLDNWGLRAILNADKRPLVGTKRALETLNRIAEEHEQPDLFTVDCVREACDAAANRDGETFHHEKLVLWLRKRLSAGAVTHKEMGGYMKEIEEWKRLDEHIAKLQEKMKLQAIKLAPYMDKQAFRVIDPYLTKKVAQLYNRPVNVPTKME